MKIDVYSTNICPPCVALKRWLNEMNLPFTNHDISNSEEAARYVMLRYGSSIPVVEIDGKGIVGFQKNKIKEMILRSLEK